MRILINPTESEKGSGTTSFISWENAELFKALNKCLGIREYEKISQIEVNKDGITVRVAERP